MSKPDRRTLLAFAGVVVLGSSNIVAVRLSGRELPPFWGAGMRFTVAAFLMFAMMAWKHLPVPRGLALRSTVFYGLLAFFVAYGLFYWGSQEVPAGVSAVIMGAVPLLTLVLALIQRLEVFRWRGLLGAVLAVAGVAAIAAKPPGGAIPIASLLLIVGAALAASQSGIEVKRIPQSHPITTNAFAMAVGAVLLLALAFATGETPMLPTSTSVWIALLYLCLATPALFILYVYVLQRWTVSAASYQFVLFPLVAVALGSILLDEPITASLLIGVPLVLTGVYFGALGSAEA